MEGGKKGNADGINKPTVATGGSIAIDLIGLNSGEVALVTIFLTRGGNVFTC